MEARQAQIEQLSTELFKNEKVVTYHTLSRNLGIHTNHAKTLLQEFYSKNKDRLTASFVITGRTKKGVLIKVSKDETKLEEDVKAFDSINTIHVYLLKLQSSQFTTQEIALEELQHRSKFDKAQEYYKNGMIRGAELKEAVNIPKPPVEIKASPSAIVTPTPASSSKPKVMRSAGISSSYVSRKKQPAKSTTPISNFASKTEPVKRTIQEPSGYQYKSRKLEKAQPKERVVVSSNVDGDNDEPVEARKKSSDPEKLQQMFDDMGDFSDFGDEDTEDIIAGSQKEEEVIDEVKSTNEEPPKETTPMFVPEDEDEEMQDSEQQNNRRTTSEDVETKADTVDEDGFVVSYRKGKANTGPKTESRPARPATNPKAKTSTATKSDGKKKQSSLMNFFSAK